MPRVSAKIADGTAPAAGTKDRKRKRWSNFFLTLNSNKRFADPEAPQYHEFKQRFQGAVDSVFSADRILEFIVVKEAGKSMDDVSEVKVSGATELAPETHTLHLHVLVSVSHYTRVKMDYQKIRAEFGKVAGLNGVYFDARVFSSAEGDIMQYVNKNVSF